MPFELYHKTRATSEEETVTITAAGVLSFSTALTEKHLKNVDAVQLYFDLATKRVGIKPTKEGEKYSYQLIQPANSRRKTVSGRGFLRTYKIGSEKAGKFAPETFEAAFENGMIVFSVK